MERYACGTMTGGARTEGTAGGEGTVGGEATARRRLAMLSVAAQAAKMREPMMPVTVTSTPAAAAAATPGAPRMRTVAAGPVLGPIGSWPTVNMTISRAIESKIETWTPTAWSISQLRST